MILTCISKDVLRRLLWARCVPPGPSTINRPRCVSKGASTHEGYLHLFTNNVNFKKEINLVNVYEITKRIKNMKKLSIFI